MSSPSLIRPMTMPLLARRTRAYFAPVDRALRMPTIFDPALNGSWNYDAPPAPWVSLGHIEGFARTAESRNVEVTTGMPAVARVQAKQSLGATIGFSFAVWNKLTMALSSGSDHMNVLASISTTATVASGGKAVSAIPLTAASTASTLYLATSSAALQAGSILVADRDYAGQVGYVGSPYSATYISSASSLANDPDYIRRFSFNVARVASIGSDGGLSLASSLPGGLPAQGMKVQQIVSFLDREGGSFFQEWSGLFAFEGVQGDSLFLYYPRLQACQGAAETSKDLVPDLTMIQPVAKFRALPIIDGNDGQQILCYRSYFPNFVSFV